MPPLPAAFIQRAAGTQLRQRALRRAFASATNTPPTSSLPSTPSTSGPSLFLNGPPSGKTQEQAKIIKFGGKGKPITPGVRHTVQVRHPHLHKGSPIRDLTVAKRKSGGRNDKGHVVNRFVGGGHKQRLRIVDFHRREAGEHDVVRIEYDPGRSAHIALIRRRDAEVVDADEGARLAEKVIERPADWMPSTHKPDNNPRELLKVRGGWSYILAPDGLRAGDVVRSYRSGVPSDLVEGLSADSTDNLDVDPSSPQSVNPPTKASSSTSSSRALGLLRTLTLKVGNVLPIELCPPGTIVHNISLTSGGKMQLCRSAGTFGQIVAHGIGKKEVSTVTEEEELLGAAASNQKAFKGWTLVKLQSGEVRKLHPGCAATVGTVSNKEHQQEQIGKAGRSRWLGRRPRVRGVAMNACDHPHGGGRGKSKGNKDPRSVWGWLTKGKRTRRPKDRDGNKMVVTERPRGRATKA